MNPASANVYLERERRIKLATRHLKAAMGLLHAVDADRKKLDIPLSVSYEVLLDAMLGAAQDIIEALPDDFFEARKTEDYLGLRASLGEFWCEKTNSSDGTLEDAEKIAATIRTRRGRSAVLRRAALLENTTGRTDEESAAYRAKAAALRA